MSSSAPALHHIRMCISTHSEIDPRSRDGDTQRDKVNDKQGGKLAPREACRAEWLDTVKEQHRDQWEASVAEADRQAAATWEEAPLEEPADTTKSPSTRTPQQRIQDRLYGVATKAILSKNGIDFNKNTRQDFQKHKTAIDEMYKDLLAKA